MYVEEIEIAGFRDTPPEGPSQGAVVLVGQDKRIQIPLTLHRHIEVAQHRRILLAEALRQARRVPEFRKKGALRFAPGLLPPELRRA